MSTTLTDIRVPADAFPLGRILQAYPEIEIELERMIPTHQGIIPLFWVESESEAAVEETLADDPLVEELVELTRTPGRRLYSVTWSPNIDGLIRVIVDLSINVLHATGTATFWEFRFQFNHRDQLRQFQQDCLAKEIPLEVLRVYNPMIPSGEGSLTAEQKDALITAYEHGYWEIPRNINQQKLAALVGLSDNSLSQRLRRGTKIAVAELLFGQDGKPVE